jgi:hypothetical protein
MLVGVSIDVGWLRGLDDGSNADVLLRVELVVEPQRQRVALIVDVEGHILSEYDRVLVNNSLGKRFASHRLRHGPLETASGRLTLKQQRALERDGFDPSDMPYVGAASRVGSSAYLTHEHKHVVPSRVRLVAKACDVLVALGDPANSLHAEPASTVSPRRVRERRPIADPTFLAVLRTPWPPVWSCGLEGFLAEDGRDECRLVAALPHSWPNLCHIRERSRRSMTSSPADREQRMLLTSLRESACEPARPSHGSMGCPSHRRC